MNNFAAEKIKELFAKMDRDVLKCFLDNNTSMVEVYKENLPSPSIVRLLFMLSGLGENDLKFNGLLQTIKHERPDIYKDIVARPNGMDWLNKQYNDFLRLYINNRDSDKVCWKLNSRLK